MIKIRDGYEFYDEDFVSEKGKISWKKSVGKKVRILYNHTLYFINIVDYNKGNLTLKCNEREMIVPSGNLRKCAIGGLLGEVTKDFKIEIGQSFKGDKRDITIIDREYREEKHGRSLVNSKYYKYKCNNCGNEDWMLESGIQKGNGCNTCCNPPRKIVLGINTVWDTDRWMCDLGVSEEDAKRYTRSSSQEVEVTCPDCGNKKMMKVSNLYYKKSIGCVCGDGFSYPEKFIYFILKQLGVEFKIQYSPDYLVRLENNKRSRKYSDFYLPDYNLVIEADGGMNHKGGKVHGHSKKTLEEYIEVDKWKDEQHKLHGVKTIRIDCKESNLEYIKENILNSELIKLFDLTKIDFIQVELYSIKNNKIKEACELKNNNSDLTTTNIAKILDIDKTTVIKYLKIGNKYDWCNYDPKEEMRKSGFRNRKHIV